MRGLTHHGQPPDEGGSSRSSTQSAASCGRIPLRSANALVAASAPADVTASGGSGQLGF